MTPPLTALVEALRPFAKAADLFEPYGYGSPDACLYAPAAGSNYNLTGADLVRARAALSAYEAAKRGASNADNRLKRYGYTPGDHWRACDDCNTFVEMASNSMCCRSCAGTRYACDEPKLERRPFP